MTSLFLDPLAAEVLPGCHLNNQTHRLPCAMHTALSNLQWSTQPIYVLDTYLYQLNFLLHYFLQWSTQPIYVLDKDNDLDVTALALANAADIVRVQPEGPYLVGGHSYGGTGAGWEELNTVAEFASLEWLAAGLSPLRWYPVHPKFAASARAICTTSRSAARPSARCTCSRHADCHGAGELGQGGGAGDGDGHAPPRPGEHSSCAEHAHA